jgi:hypothetical protein
MPMGDASSPSALLTSVGTSDFCLLRDVKRQLAGCSSDDAEDLVTAAKVILDPIEKAMLISVFDEWVQRLEQCLGFECD